jgi:hypothetical protein
MATTKKTAEERVCRLVTQANIDYNETVAPWDYELTSEVDNLSVVVTASAKTLQINPYWLRFVLERHDFRVSVADEIAAWYLIQGAICNA